MPIKYRDCLREFDRLVFFQLIRTSKTYVLALDYPLDGGLMDLKCKSGKFEGQNSRK
jgi:hypothetical protein